jgi:hypothetical protein
MNLDNIDKNGSDPFKYWLKKGRHNQHGKSFPTSWSHDPHNANAAQKKEVGPPVSPKYSSYFGAHQI